MKNKVGSLFLAVMLLTATKPSVSSAQVLYETIYNELPLSPVINIAHDIIETGGSFLSIASQATTLAINVKQSVSNLLVSVNSILSALGVNINFGNRIKVDGFVCNAKISDINTSQLALKMRDTFLVYRKFYQRDMVSEKRRHFYIDNIYNMYAMVKAIQADMEDGGEIGAAIIKTKGCAEGDSSAMEACGITGQPDNTESSAEDSGEEPEAGNTENLQLYGYTLNTLSDLVKVWERVAALKAQFRALQSFMKVNISPKYDYSDNQKISYLPSENYSVLTSKYGKHTAFALAAAQVIYKEAPTSSLKETVVPATTDEVMQKIDDNIDTSGLGLHFSAPVPDEIGSPLVDNADKLDSYGDLDDVESIVQKAADAHNFVIKLDPYRTNALQYKKMLAKYAKKLAVVVEADGCGINYTGRYFQTPEVTWSGKKFNINNVNHYDDRKGITGWAIDAYDIAKAAQTNISQDNNGNVDYSNGSSFNVDSVEAQTLSNDETYDAEDGENWDKAESKADKMNEGGDDGTKMSASSLQKTQDENRNASLISWQIGAEAAKLLGQDPQMWGTPTNRKMIWNDTKAFYNQYLNRKYQNIKAYLKRYTKEDVIDVFVSKLQNTLLDINQTDYQNDLSQQRAVATAGIIAALGEADDDDSLVSPQLIQKRNELIKKIDDISAKIKVISEQISDVSSQSEESSQQALLSDAVKDVDFSENSAAEVKKVKGFKDSFIERSLQTNQGLISGNFSGLKAQEKALQQQRNVYNKELQQLEKAIKLAKTEAQAKTHSVSGNRKSNALSAVISTFGINMLQAHNAYKGAVEGRLDTALALIAAGEPEAAVAAKVAIEEASDEVINALNLSIDTIVNSTLAELVALGDNLYLPASANQVKAIHQAMIDKLKAVTIAKSVLGYTIEGMAAFAELESLDSSSESEGFFVGALPRARDLKAPYPLSDFSQPPVREIFHFDTFDYANLKPYNAQQYQRYLQYKNQLKDSLLSDSKKDEIKQAMQALLSISRKEFLAMGNDMPKIWQVMLQDNAFIEAQFQLKDVLNQGCENVAFLRGGIFPCYVEGSDVVLDVNITKEYDEDLGRDRYDFDMDEDEYRIRKDINANSVPKCLFVKMKKGSPYHVLWDEKVSTPSFFDNLSSSGDPVERSCRYSELGMLLDADDNNNTFFKSTVYETFNNSSVADSKDEDDMKKKDKNRMALARHAELSRNQIGDFLLQMEQEKKFKQSLDKMKESYDEQMAELKGRLKEFGFVVGDNYDITKDSDYNLTISRLKEAQENEIKKTVSALNRINVKGNNAAQKRVDTINRLMDVMKQDKDCVMEVSLISAADNNLTEELKKAKANKKATDKFNEKVKSKMQDEDEGTDYTYCSNY